MKLETKMWIIYLNLFILIGFLKCFSRQIYNKGRTSVDIPLNADNCTSFQCNYTINKHNINDQMQSEMCYKLYDDTCKGINQNLFQDGNHNCFCDDFCYYYWDCCKDIVIQKLQINNDKLYNQRLLTMMNITHYTCKEFSEFGVYLVDSCATDWGSDDISSQCKTNLTEKEYVFLHIPVTNTYVNITYRNIYCAVCNNENDKEIKAWTLKLICHSSDSNLTNMIHDLRFSPDDGLWHRKGSDNMGTKTQKAVTCTHSIRPGDIVINSVRRCKTDITCPNNWQHSNISDLCQNFTVYRYDLMNVTLRYKRYNSKYCTICNGVNVRDLKCKIAFPKPRKTVITDMSLNILMDVNFNEGGQKVGREDTCDKGEIYDLATGMCRKVSCGRFARMINGTCKELS